MINRNIIKKQDDNFKIFVPENSRYLEFIIFILLVLVYDEKVQTREHSNYLKPNQ